jgi:hypothetical protein
MLKGTPQLRKHPVYFHNFVQKVFSFKFSAGFEIFLKTAARLHFFLADENW